MLCCHPDYGVLLNGLIIGDQSANKMTAAFALVNYLDSHLFPEEIDILIGVL